MPEYLTTSEVADQIRMTAEYVARQCKAGRIRAVKLGDEWRIPRDAVAEFMSGSVPAARVRLTARQKRRAS